MILFRTIEKHFLSIGFVVTEIQEDDRAVGINNGWVIYDTDSGLFEIGFTEAVYHTENKSELSVIIEASNECQI